MTKLSTNNSNVNSPCTISGVAYNDCADLLYSTFLGGSEEDEGFGVAVDSDGNVYVTGWTRSADFPTKNGFQTGNVVNRDAFVVKLKPDNSNTPNPCSINGVNYNDCDDLLYSTRLGGSSDETGGDQKDDIAIAVDSSGFIYVTGTTFSPDFPGKGGVTAPKLV